LKHQLLRLVQVVAELDHRQHIAAASNSDDAVSVRVSRARKLRGDILNNILIEFTCSPLVYLLNSRPM